MNNNYNKYFTETENGLDIEANNINANCITSQSNKFSLDSEGNLTVNSINFNTSENNLLSFEAIFNKIYPVGAIYISTNEVNPGTLFVGSWEQIVGKFLLASNNTSAPYALGKTGGEVNHTLTIAEMPTHAHNPSNYGANWVPAKNLGRGRCAYSSSGTNYVISGDSFDDYVWGSTAPSGGGKAHNNMPPFLSVNIWKRVS